MESEYLQREVGTVLARALAETAVAMPADPIEFLGQWLIANARREDALAALQKREEATAVEKRRVELEQRDAIARAERQRAEAEAAAAAVEAARVAAIEARIAPVEEALAQADTAAEALDEKKRKTRPLARWTGRLEALRGAMGAPELVADAGALPRGRAPQAPVQHVVAMALYLFDLVDDPIEPWKVVRPVLREENIVEHLSTFDPLSLQRSSKFRRVERRLLALDEAAVRKASFVAFLVHEWLKLCVEMRKAATAWKITKLGLTDEPQPAAVQPLAPGERSEEDDQDEEAEDEEDLGQVIDKILRSEIEAEELEQEEAARQEKAAAAAASGATEDEEEDEEEGDEEDEE